MNVSAWHNNRAVFIYVKVIEVENIKVKVNTENKAEVFDLLVDLGGKRITNNEVYVNLAGDYLFLHNSTIWTSLIGDQENDCRLVEIQELKEMVAKLKDASIFGDVSALPDFTPMKLEIKSERKKLHQGEINYRAANAYNKIKGDNAAQLTEDDVQLVLELIGLIKSHGEYYES